MKKIIHMSDVHVGYRDMEQRFFSVVDNLIFEKGETANEYVLVITGDLADSAHRVESHEKVREGLHRLRQAGFEHILVVPGNHDYGTGDRGDKKFVKRFQKIFYGHEITMPKLDIIDACAFIGLDSMSEELHWVDGLFANGEIGERQLQSLDLLLRRQDVVSCQKRIIYLHHHPFDPRPFHELKDSRQLKEVLHGNKPHANVVDAVLYGHNHQGKVHNGKWGILRCYDAGTVTLKPRPRVLNWFPVSEVKASTRVIKIANNDTSVDYELNLL